MIRNICLLYCSIVCCFVFSCQKDSIDSFRVVSKIMYKLSGDDYVRYKSLNKKLEKFGWSYKDGYLESTITFPNKKIILSNGDTVTTDKNSYLNLSNKKDNNLEKIILDGQIYNLKQIENQLILNLPNYLIKMDGCCTSNSDTRLMSLNKLTVMAAPPRCNDFNGPLGNGLNDQSGLQEFLNFAGSDCSIALAQGNCLSEHMNGKGGCYNTHGGKLCGELISTFDPGRNGGLSISPENK